MRFEFGDESPIRLIHVGARKTSTVTGVDVVVVVIDVIFGIVGHCKEEEYQMTRKETTNLGERHVHKAPRFRDKTLVRDGRNFGACFAKLNDGNRARGLSHTSMKGRMDQWIDLYIKSTSIHRCVKGRENGRQLIAYECQTLLLGAI